MVFCLSLPAAPHSAPRMEGGGENDRKNSHKRIKRSFLSRWTNSPVYYANVQPGRAGSHQSSCLPALGPNISADQFRPGLTPPGWKIRGLPTSPFSELDFSASTIEEISLLLGQTNHNVKTSLIKTKYPKSRIWWPDL